MIDVDVQAAHYGMAKRLLPIEIPLLLVYCCVIEKKKMMMMITTIMKNNRWSGAWVGRHEVDKITRTPAK